MRIVSALYADFHPWDQLPFANSFEVCENHRELKKGDILVVHGGSDIHPSLYGKGRSSHTWCGKEPSQRDKIEWNLMQQARELGIPIVGICRGAQMLCALAGGYLIQHVNNHGGSHSIETIDGRNMLVNSIHHQMMQPRDTEHELIAWAAPSQSDIYFDEEETVFDIEKEPEFVYFNAIKGFAFQWHPEAMHHESPASRYILNFIEEKIQ